MAIARAALAIALAALVAIVVVSGGTDSDPKTPPALPGEPPPFLGTAVTGYGGVVVAVDAYGDVVDFRARPVAAPLIDNPSARQAAGTVPVDTGIVPRVALAGGDPEPLWRADSVAQRYEPGTNVVRTVARFGRARVVVRTAADGIGLAMTIGVEPAPGELAISSVGVNLEGGAHCGTKRRGDGDLVVTCGPRRIFPVPARTTFQFAHGAARTRLEGAPSLGPGAPAWARAMYRRSILVLQALTDPESGAVAAGARDGWDHVWPRDAATVALALAATGRQWEAKKIARFLDGLPLDVAARFEGNGSPVPGRGPQGDALGWVRIADRAAGLEPLAAGEPGAWRNLPDYREESPGDYLGNALAATWVPADPHSADGPISGHMDTESAHRPPAAASLGAFVTQRGLVREAGDPGSGLDSAAAWAVRPFATPSLYPAARRTLLRLLHDGTRFGITPGEGWTGGEDPWTAPTAASAWALAALGERAPALRLLADLRRAATPAGLLPERVDIHTGLPRSTTPLAWSHAFAILALQELWPPMGRKPTHTSGFRPVGR